MTRILAAAAAAATLAGCAGKITARDMGSLAHYRDRPVVLAPAPAGRYQEVAERARRGAEAPLEPITAAAGGAEGAAPPLVVEVYPVPPGEGHDRSRTAVGVAGELGRAVGGVVGDATDVATTLAGAGTRFLDAAHVRVALLLRDPDRRDPLGGVVWEGLRGVDAGATAEEAGRVAGEALAAEIAEARERWVTRRPGDERLFLTPTPLLLAPGEKVVSNDMLLVFHAGIGVKRWLQLDATLGALPIPVAGGIVYAGEGGVAGAGGAGIVAIGIASLGAKVRVLEEGALVPGVSVAYDVVDVWGGALGAGGVFLLGKGIAGAAAAGAAGTNLQLNVFTLAASKHPREWLHVGGGAYLVDNHAWLPEGSGVVIVTSGGETSGGTTEKEERLPTTLMPFASVEAAAGSHWRFISEYLMAPGPDYFTFGARAVIFGSGKIAGIRKPGLRLRLDLAAVMSDGKDGLRAMPFVAAGLYL